MDNRLNAIRRKISILRDDMLALEGRIAAQVLRNKDCSENSFQLMKMRGDLASLIIERNALGGAETIPLAVIRGKR